MTLSLYFSIILLLVSVGIVIELLANKKIAFLVALYWCIQVIRYLFEIFHR